MKNESARLHEGMSQLQERDVRMWLESRNLLHSAIWRVYMARVRVCVEFSRTRRVLSTLSTPHEEAEQQIESCEH